MSKATWLNIGGTWKDFISYITSSVDVSNNGFYFYDSNTSGGDKLFHKIDPITLNKTGTGGSVGTPFGIVIYKYCGDFFYVSYSTYIYKFSLKTGTLITTIGMSSSSKYPYFKSSTMNFFVSHVSGDIIYTWMENYASGGYNNFCYKFKRVDQTGATLYEKLLSSDYQNHVYDMSMMTLYSGCIFLDDDSTIVDLGAGDNRTSVHSSTYVNRLDRAGNILSGTTFTASTSTSGSKNDTCIFKLNNDTMLRLANSKIEVYTKDLAIISSIANPGMSAYELVYHNKDNTILSPTGYNFDKYSITGQKILTMAPIVNGDQIRAIDNDFNIYEKDSLNSAMKKYNKNGVLISTGSDYFYQGTFIFENITL